METRRQGPLWAAMFAFVALAVLLSTGSGRGLAGRFLSSLRIEKPQPVGVSMSPLPGSNPDREVQDLISGMIAESASLTESEDDQPVENPETTARVAGFPLQLLKARSDSVTLTVRGAHTVAMQLKRAQLVTILAQAGQSTSDVPESVDGAKVTLRTPRAVRAQYGHCPAPVDTSIQGQIQGPPPTTPANNDCVVITEGPIASADLPAGLDMERLVTVALELSGMSPNQVRDFQGAFDWNAALSFGMPRNMRSYEMVDVRGVRGMLLTAGGRRGPTYTLVWQDKGILYSLSGYGSVTEAVPLANSLG